jgi:uncharacterized protein (TIGR03067 family)
MKRAFASSLFIYLLATQHVDAANLPQQAALDTPPDPVQQEFTKLQGTWQRVYMEVQGKPVPDMPGRNWTADYDGNKLTVCINGVIYRRSIVTLDPRKTPKATNSWDANGPAADQTWAGIYEIDGDTMKICFAEPGNKRPTEFTTKQGTGYLYCEYKRSRSYLFSVWRRELESELARIAATCAWKVARNFVVL